MTTMKTTSAQSWRWLKAIFAASLIVLMISLLAGCGGGKEKECKHEWAAATCTEAATCSKCGETQGSPLGHTYTGRSCTGVDKCITCGSIVPSSGHSWVDATCSEPKTCSKCNTTEGDPLGHDMVNGICTRCGDFGEQVFNPLSGNGTGNGEVKDIILGYDYYALHLTHNGSDLFEVKMTDATGATAILAHKKGAYDGTVLMYGASPLSFEITANGDWTYEISKTTAGEGSNFSGTGDSVTSSAAIPSGAYHVTHNGSGDFYVYAFYYGGAVEVVKPGAVKGAYDANVDLTFPADAPILFEVHADGEWSISPTT